MSSYQRQRTGAHRPRRRPGALALPLLLAVVVVAAVVVGLRVVGQRDAAHGRPLVSKSAAVASATASGTGSPSVTPSSSGTPSLPPAAVDHAATVRVLNATGRAGLATRAAATLRSAGWSVVSTGNYPQPPPRTTVYYPGERLRATARALSSDLPGAQRVERSAQFGDAVVTVVLGTDYAG